MKLDPNEAPHGFIAKQMFQGCTGCFFQISHGPLFCDKGAHGYSLNSCMSYNRSDRTNVIYVKRDSELPEDL